MTSNGVRAERAPARWWAVHLSGDVDLATAPDLDALMARVEARHRNDGVVLDLSAVPFMDCAGLHPLVRARRRLGSGLRLRAPQRRVLRLLQLTDLVDRLGVLHDVDAWPAEADPQQCGRFGDDPPDLTSVVLGS